MKYKVEYGENCGDWLEDGQFDDYEKAFDRAQDIAQYEYQSNPEEYEVTVSERIKSEEDETEDDEYEDVWQTIDVIPFIQTWAVYLNCNRDKPKWEDYKYFSARKRDEALEEALYTLYNEEVEALERENLYDEEIDEKLYEKYKDLQIKTVALQGYEKDVRTEEIENIECTFCELNDSLEAVKPWFKKKLTYRVETVDALGNCFNARVFDKFSDAFAEVQNEAQFAVCDITEAFDRKIRVTRISPRNGEYTLYNFPYMQKWEVKFNRGEKVDPWTEKIIRAKWEICGEAGIFLARNPEEAVEQAFSWLVHNSDDKLVFDGCKKKKIVASISDKFKNYRLCVSEWGSDSWKTGRIKKGYNAEELIERGYACFYTK